MNRIQRVAALAFTYLCLTAGAQANDLVVREFEKQQLTPVYWSEGANFGDFNQDGHQDVVSGPHMWLGPDFKHRYEFYPAVAPTKRLPYDFGIYSNDNFFSFVYDFNADGWPDVLTAGLPNTPAYWYQNPGEAFGGEPPERPVHWERHFVIDRVKNEAPTFADITGDGVPELLMAYSKHYGLLCLAEPCRPDASLDLSQDIDRGRRGSSLHPRPGLWGCRRRWTHGRDAQQWLVATTRLTGKRSGLGVSPLPIHRSVGNRYVGHHVEGGLQHVRL